MALTTSSAQTSSITGSLPTAGSSSSSTIPVRLDRNNFLLWKTQVIPNLSGSGHLGFIDGSFPTPLKTITTGTGADVVTAPNPEYTAWWHTDQRVLSVLLGSITEYILAQMIGRTTSASVWSCLSSMFSTQGRASIRAYRCKLATTKRNDMGVADYFHLMKGYAATMATVGAPLPDDELIDYILAGLGNAFAPLQASLNVFSNTNPDAVIHLTDFYSMLVSHEAMQELSAHETDFTSSANAARRGDYGRPNSGHSGGGQGSLQQVGGHPGGGSYQGGGYQGQGGGGNYHGSGHNGGGYYGQGGGYQGARNGGRNGGQGGGGQNGGRYNGGGRRRRRTRCQIYGIWGHEALTCRNRFNQVYHADDSRSGNTASTSHNHHDAPPHWIMDTGATNHLTHDMERLHFHEPYHDRDQVQVANGTGQGHEENRSSR